MYTALPGTTPVTTNTTNAYFGSVHIALNQNRLHKQYSWTESHRLRGVQSQTKCRRYRHASDHQLSISSHEPVGTQPNAKVCKLNYRALCFAGFTQRSFVFICTAFISSIPIDIKNQTIAQHVSTVLFKNSHPWTPISTSQWWIEKKFDRNQDLSLV